MARSPSRSFLSRRALQRTLPARARKTRRDRSAILPYSPSSAKAMFRRRDVGNYGGSGRVFLEDRQRQIARFPGFNRPERATTAGHAKELPLFLSCQARNPIEKELPSPPPQIHAFVTTAVAVYLGVFPYGNAKVADVCLRVRINPVGIREQFDGSDVPRDRTVALQLVVRRIVLGRTGKSFEKIKARTKDFAGSGSVRSIHIWRQLEPLPGDLPGRSRVGHLESDASDAGRTAGCVVWHQPCTIEVDGRHDHVIPQIDTHVARVAAEALNQVRLIRVQIVRKDSRVGGVQIIDKS